MNGERSVYFGKWNDKNVTYSVICCVPLLSPILNQVLNPTNEPWLGCYEMWGARNIHFYTFFTPYILKFRHTTRFEKGHTYKTLINEKKAWTCSHIYIYEAIYHFFNFPPIFHYYCSYNFFFTKATRYMRLWKVRCMCVKWIMFIFSISERSLPDTRRF